MGVEQHVVNHVTFYMEGVGEDAGEAHDIVVLTILDVTPVFTLLVLHTGLDCFKFCYELLFSGLRVFGDVFVPFEVLCFLYGYDHLLDAGEIMRCLKSICTFEH